MRSKEGFVPTKATLLFILLASMMILMGGAAIAPALPLISEAFPDSSEMTISLIVTLPSLAIALTGFLVGYLADRFGKVRTMVISLLLFSIAGVTGYFLNSITSILIGRFILGIGIAGISVAATALIAEYYTGFKREKIIGLQTASMGIGILFLETGGGLLADIGWREPFLIYLVGFVIVSDVILTMREPGDKGYVKPNEMTGITKRNTILVCYVTIFLAFAVAFLLPTKLPYYMEQMGATPLISGIMLGWHGICESVCCLMYHRISSRLSRTAMISSGFLMIGIGFCMLYITGSYLLVAISVGLIGAGVGMMTPTLVSWLATTVSSQTSGKIMSGYSVSLNLGQFCSSLLVAPLLVIVVTYANMFVVMGAVALIACVFYAAYSIKLKGSVYQTA